MIGPTTPTSKRDRFGLFPLRSPLLWESLVNFFSSAYLDVSVRRVRFHNLCIQLWIMDHYFHWVSPFGDLRVNAFFQLAEAFRRLRVLHRLLMPRHPPAALNSLTKNF
jgi:hypothetical protein